MAEHGFFHPTIGYWQTNSDPPEHIIEAYPEGTVEIPLRPAGDWVWSGSAWLLSAPAKFDYRLKKTTVWQRMSDAEADSMEPAMLAMTTKQRLTYNASEFLYTTEPFWGDFRDLLVTKFGVARADELLAPEA